MAASVSWNTSLSGWNSMFRDVNTFTDNLGDFNSLDWQRGPYGHPNPLLSQQNPVLSQATPIYYTNSYNINTDSQSIPNSSLDSFNTTPEDFLFDSFNTNGRYVESDTEDLSRRRSPLLNNGTSPLLSSVNTMPNLTIAGALPDLSVEADLTNLSSIDDELSSLSLGVVNQLSSKIYKKKIEKDPTYKPYSKKKGKHDPIIKFGKGEKRGPPKPKRKYMTARRRRELAENNALDQYTVSVSEGDSTSSHYETDTFYDQPLNSSLYDDQLTFPTDLEISSGSTRYPKRKSIGSHVEKKRKHSDNKSMDLMRSQIFIDHDYWCSRQTFSEALCHQTELASTANTWLRNELPNQSSLEKCRVKCETKLEDLEIFSEEIVGRRKKKRCPSRAKMDDAKRDEHNATERLRRLELSNHFNGLRDIIDKRFFKKSSNNPSKNQIIIAAETMLTSLFVRIGHLPEVRMIINDNPFTSETGGKKEDNLLITSHSDNFTLNRDKKRSRK